MLDQNETLAAAQKHHHATGNTFTPKEEAFSPRPAAEQETAGHGQQIGLEDGHVSRNTHPTIKVRVNGTEADIDVMIAPLIEEVWKAGIATGLSCQDNPPGWVWLWFPTVVDCEQFLNVVADFDEDPNSLYNRIRQAWTSDHEDKFWRYDLSFDDLSVEENEDGTEVCTASPDFVGGVSVRFPHEDLPEVLEMLRSSNKSEVMK